MRGTWGPCHTEGAQQHGPGSWVSLFVDVCRAWGPCFQGIISWECHNLRQPVKGSACPVQSTVQDSQPQDMGET